MSGEQAISIESGRLTLPAVVIHGGAGNFARIGTAEDESALAAALDAALSASWSVLSRGGTALDAVVEAVAALEDCGRFNAGRGAVPTVEGTVEFDASVMDQASGVVGAICAASYPANPVRAARAVAEAGSLPDGPVLLAGRGADRFCAANGLEEMAPARLTGVDGADDAPPTLSGAGTVGAVAVDSTGQVAAATSTGGRAGQLPGRVGDSPIPGAGVLASRSGVAVSATGTGEVFLVSGFAHQVAWSYELGRPLAPSVEAALRVVGALGGEGGAVALTAEGDFVLAFSSRAMARGWRSGENSKTRLRP